MLGRHSPLQPGRCVPRAWASSWPPAQGQAGGGLWSAAPPRPAPAGASLTQPVSLLQELLLLLQNLPTAHWGDGDVSLLLAEAYRLKFAFADAPNHYKR